ncbi:hypothetical protein CDL12_21374 [Handroanthus impetiginosus]|uniref:Uncharacterized protein n=1 Tax=Handroanthus impetiginosus TaxID=429701 RepID=A0A2G9GLE8_9LAMI|nr:hypothetical protein CDL12_21374 [Handroanthus impetiginosus]
MESWKTRINYSNYQKPSGRFKANEPCKKHPKHTQSPGVCSICLGEKLSRLTNSSVSKPARSSLSSSSSSSDISPLSSSSSSYSSPVNYHRKSTRFFKNSGQDVLQKSRSTAFVSYMRRKNEDENGKKVDAKRGFWSKLLLRKNKRMTHSRTMREMVVAEVH